MEPVSALLACDTWIPLTKPVTRSFDFCYLRLNKRLSKQSRRRWFERPLCSLWRHSNETSTCLYTKASTRTVCNNTHLLNPVNGYIGDMVRMITIECIYPLIKCYFWEMRFRIHISIWNFSCWMGDVSIFRGRHAITVLRLVIWIKSMNYAKYDAIMTHCPIQKNGQYIDGLVQDCSNSSALAMELLQSWTSIWCSHVVHCQATQNINSHVGVYQQSDQLYTGPSMNIPRLALYQ